MSTTSQMTEFFVKLEEVTKRQDEYNLQYLSQLNKPTNSDPLCVSDVAGA